MRKDKSWVLNVILYWTDEDVWNVIHQENIPYCSVYDEIDENGCKMFKRMGCVGCPMAGKQRIKEFRRWPKIHAGWQRAFQRFWENWHNVPLEKPRWVSMEGKYHFSPLPSERKERQWVEKTGRVENGFWTLRRWYDLREIKDASDLWLWWMQMEDDPEGCTMGLW